MLVVKKLSVCFHRREGEFMADKCITLEESSSLMVLL